MSTRGKRPGFQVAACLLLAAPVAAHAEGTCTVSATGPAFGVYDPTSATPLNANGMVTAVCSWTGGAATTLTVTIAYGPGNSGNDADRYMLSGTSQLHYNLFDNATYTTIKGNGSSRMQIDSAKVTVSSGQPTTQVQFPLFGQIQALQDVPPGTYTDNIVVTVTY